MTVHAPVTMTKEAFLAWVDQREERYEFSGGRVIMLVRVTRNHARVTKNLLVGLGARLSSESYDVMAEAFAFISTTASASPMSWSSRLSRMESR